MKLAGRAALAAMTLGLVLGGCKPSSVSEAEAKGDVAWLAKNATPEATAALGRLADKDPNAVKALEARGGDVSVYIAAWTAAQRNAGWGATVLREGLADPAQAEVAASALTRGDPHLGALVTDLEGALTREAAGSSDVSLPAVLASVGPTAHGAIERRLADKATRGVMCHGIASPDASADAKHTLLAVAETSRDDAACVDTVVHMAAVDDGALTWLAGSGEPGLVSAAAKSDSIPCPRLRAMWTELLAVRPPASHFLLAVPLAHSVKRCASVLDPLLASTLATHPESAALVVGGVDPFGSETTDLKATCAALPAVLKTGAPPRTKDRAADAIAHGCKAAK